MKKWILVFIILFIVEYGAVRYKYDVTKQRHVEQGNQITEISPRNQKLAIKVTKDQIHQGNLLLVNQDHPVPRQNQDAEAVNLIEHKELVRGFGLLDNTIRLSPDLVKKFSTMIEAADKEGVSHFIISSGYRDDIRQDELYRQMGADYAMPAGHSEHNLGLSIDIGSTQAEMKRAEEGKWLKENAWKYGFVLRYPNDKTAITGIQYEPWHFRYVGLPHSAVMQEKNLVLEQYLDLLKEQKTIQITINHQTCQIFYYPISRNTTIQVPANGRYEISGNNTDGVIVTVYTGTGLVRPQEGEDDK